MMVVNDQVRKNDDMDIKLKQFYSTSQTYLERLKKHDEEHFSSYIQLCKKLAPRDSSILDSGCGIGVSSYLLAKAGLKVTAIDISPLFVFEAKKRYTNRPELRFLVGDTVKMPFLSQSFSMVCSFDLLEHVTNVKSVLKEMCRVLKNRGLLVIFTSNRLDVIQHLTACIRWKTKQSYKPWEARSRIEAFYQFVRTTFLLVAKAIGISEKIYYLRPVLSDDENVCGEDFDAVWLTNWFDIENSMKKLGFSITYPQDFEDKIMHLIRVLRLPRLLQVFYMKTRKPCVIAGIKE